MILFLVQFLCSTTAQKVPKRINSKLLFRNPSTAIKNVSHLIFAIEKAKPPEFLTIQAVCYWSR